MDDAAPPEPPYKTMSRGNLLGRIASLKKYMKHLLPERLGAPSVLTEKDRQRLRREAEKRTGIEKGETAPLTSDDILAVWNDVNGAEKNPELLAYIARLDGKEKAQILRGWMRIASVRWICIG